MPRLNRIENTYASSYRPSIRQLRLPMDDGKRNQTLTTQKTCLNATTEDGRIKIKDRPLARLVRRALVGKEENGSKEHQELHVR